MMIEAPGIMADRILAIAVSMHGDSVDSAPWREMENGPEVGYPAGDGRPNVHVDAKNAYVRWWRPDGKSVRYDIEAGSPPRRKLRIPGMDAPHMTVIAMAGMKLSRIMRVPGDPGLVVEAAHVEQLGEFRHLVLRLKEE